MKVWPVIAIVSGCSLGPSAESAPPAHEATPAVVTAARPDSCRDDIPDCAAACALRETVRRDFLDYFDRRCAAVILGKNPDRAVGEAAAVDGGPDFPPDVRASLMVSRPFDPTTMSRTGSGEPVECRAARVLRAQRRDHEADVLDAMCIAKGGGLDAGP